MQFWARYIFSLKKIINGTKCPGQPTKVKKVYGHIAQGPEVSKGLCNFSIL